MFPALREEQRRGSKGGGVKGHLILDENFSNSFIVKLEIVRGVFFVILYCFVEFNIKLLMFFNDVIVCVCLYILILIVCKILLLY